MKPKEKAIELYNKMYETGFKPKSVLIRIEQAKECALIAVDEILKEYAHAENHIEDIMGKISIYIKYWQEVKKEIELL
jgi:hypothetical protein